MGYDVDRECCRGLHCTAVETMNQMPNILVQLGEALGSGGSIAVLLLLCGGTVWVVMSVRRNKDDHDRLLVNIESLRKESQEDSKETRGEIESLRKESQEDSKETRGKIEGLGKETRGKIDDLGKETRAKIDDLGKETREDSKETQETLRSISSRLDQLIDRKPPDRPG